jgi:hypothetical protein
VRQPDSPTGAHVWLVNSCRCAAAVTLAAAILLLLRVRGRSALIIVTAAAATAAELQLRAPLYRCKASSTAHQGDGGRQASHTNAIAPAPSDPLSLWRLSSQSGALGCIIAYRIAPRAAAAAAAACARVLDHQSRCNSFRFLL